MKPPVPAKDMTQAQLARYIDSAILKPEFTEEDVKKYAQQGIDLGVNTICVNPCYLELLASMVEGTQTGIDATCDFPFGQSSTASKVAQAVEVFESVKPSDMDMVANYGMLRAGDKAYVVDDIQAVCAVAHDNGAILKVILETDALTPEQIALGVECAIEAGADYVKSSTGFYAGGPQKGATPEVVSLMLKAADGKIKVKGSGCIRTQERFFELIDLGMDRAGVGFGSVPKVLGAE